MNNTAPVPGKAISLKGRITRRRCASAFLIFSLGQLLVMAATASDEPTAQRFLGAQSCASSMCHGGADDRRNQFIVWSKKDFHTRAPATLNMARSARIAETLKINDATGSARCTVCHNPFQTVPAAGKGPLVGNLEGVSCESCHNAAGPWLLTHTRTDLTYDQKVAAGLRDLKNLYVRANTCVACHQNLDPELRAAGHPELIFEMDGQCVSMPRHWNETNRLRGAPAWLVGQAVALREAAAQRARGDVTDDVQGNAAALAWLTALPEDSGAADESAKKNSSTNWSTTEARAHLTKLVSLRDEFTGAADASGRLARRAERLVIGLDRLLVALKLDESPVRSLTVDQLFKDIQSRPDFSPARFAEHLRTFEEELKKVPAP